MYLVKVFLCFDGCGGGGGVLQDLTRCNQLLFIDLPTFFWQITHLGFLLSVSLYPLGPYKSFLLTAIILRTVLETQHTRAPLRVLSRMPGESWGPRLAGTKNETNTERKPRPGWGS